MTDKRENLKIAAARVSWMLAALAVLWVAYGAWGNALAATADPPTMGWSSWNTYRVNISDTLIVRQAEAIVARGLRDAGYTYINIDDGFFGGRDAEGRLLTHSGRFPRGLKPVADRIHGLGLKAGIYSDAGRNTCGSFWDGDSAGTGVGLYGHDSIDAEFYFRESGFDFIKIDFCGGDAGQNAEHFDLDERERYTAIRRAIDATGRTDVRVNICRWAFPGTWAREVGTSWRIAADIAPNWNSVRRIIAANRYLSAYATAGAYNDMDMLEVGRGLTEAQERTHFGMWCMQSSPLLIGCDVTALPERSLALLSNPELIALDQDTLGRQARVVRVSSDGLYLYVKDLVAAEGTVRAVAIYNPTDSDRVFRLDMSDVELCGRVAVRDLFARAALPDVADGCMDIPVGRHDTRIFRLEAERRSERVLYEAETAWLERYQELGINPALGHAVYKDDAGCSGGARVAWLGLRADNFLEWRDVYSAEGGAYRLTLRCLSDEPRSVWCSVNGAPAVRLVVPAADTGCAAEAFVDVPLRKGYNSVRLFNPDAWCPDIDCMTVVRRD